MQRLRTIMTVLALVGVLGASVSLAQQRDPLLGQSPGAPVEPPGTPEVVTPKAVKAGVPLVLKATSIIGSTVMNRQGESLGKIEELVMGIHTNRDKLPSIAYSAEMILCTISAILQSTDRHHGIVGEECCHFQRDS